jgi:hypothetical protein
MKTKASLVPNPDHKTRKIKMTSANKNLTRFYLQKKKKQNKVMTRKHTQNWC